MVRPRRLYITDDNKFYYLIKGKKRFVKVPDISEKQISRINIKNVVNPPAQRRVKRRRKKIQPKFSGPINSILTKTEQGGLPIYFYQPNKTIRTIEDIVKGSTDTSIDKLAKLLLKGTTPVPSSSRIQPTITDIESERTKEFLSMDKQISNIKTVRSRARKEQRDRENKRALELIKIPRDLYEFDLPPTPAIPKTRPRSESKENFIVNETKEFEPASLGLRRLTGSEAKESKNRLKRLIRERDDVMPSLRTKAKTTAEKLAETSSFSGSTSGTITPAGIPKSDAELAREEARRMVEGSGEGDGLYNTEIETIVKKRIKDYVPVIASDEVESLMKFVGRGDKRFGFVMNTNPSTSDGSGTDGHRVGHWLAIYINNEDDFPTVEYFDPLAEGKMSDDLIRMTRKIAGKMNPEMMFKYKQNMLRRQSKLSSNCGHHAVKFLEDRFNAIPFSKATGYDDFMLRMEAPDDSVDGEKDIMKSMKKYDSYI